MNVETIIAIITAGIAFLTSVASFTYNLIEHRKERVKQIILDNRIKYMDEMREGFTNIIGLANDGSVKAARGDSDVKKIFFEKLFTGYGKLKTYIKPFYDIDKELLTSLDKLYDKILAAVNGKSNAETETLNELRNDFEDKYLKYDWAYWKYIQKQKSGSYMNSDDAFDNVYYNFVNSLK